MILLGCEKTQRSDSSAPPKIDPLTLAKTDSLYHVREDSIAHADSIQHVSDKKVLTLLKTKFVFKEDEVRGGGWYTHKSQTVSNSWNRQYLDAPVHSTGYTYLHTNYYGHDWIFHTRLVVRIGDKVIESVEIPTYSDDNHTNAGSGHVWESLNLTDDRDNGIFEAIVNAGSVPIIVRYEGEHYYTYNLSTQDRQALKDSYDLARLLSN